MRRISAVLTVMVFACSFLFVVSCAKKQVKTEETVVREAKPEAPPAPVVQQGESDEYKKAEAERQARLRELEREALVKKEMEAFMAESIYFDFDRSELKPEAQATLKRKANWLKEHPDLFLRIEGHCDERGTNEYNLALGERRAQAARQFLVDLGISESRIRTISYGEEKPAVQGHNEDAWSKNRRDEFKLLQ